MCDFGISEIIIGSILAATALASTAVSVTSSVQQGKNQQAMYDYQAQVDRNNAKIAQDKAASERQKGIEESRLQRMKTLQNVGTQQSAMAANGIDVTQGTPLDVVEDTAAMGELDALTISYNQEEKARAYTAQSDNFTNQSNLDVLSGKNAYTAGTMNGIASGIKGLGDATKSVASIWYG